MNPDTIQAWARRATPADLAAAGFDNLQVLAADMLILRLAREGHPEALAILEPMADQAIVDPIPIPAGMLPGLTRYVDFGIPPGSFLQAVICGEWRLAARLADDANAKILPAFGAWLLRNAPPQSHGSRANFEAWMAQRGRQMRAAA